MGLDRNSLTIPWFFYKAQDVTESFVDFDYITCKTSDLSVNVGVEKRSYRNRKPMVIIHIKSGVRKKILG